MLPPATGMPSGSPVAAAASRLTVPHCSCGQTSRGSGTPGATLLLPVVDPRVAVHVVERRPVACAVVVEDVLAGEARDDEGTRAVDAPGRRPHLRLIVGEPADLGSRGLARQPRAAAREDLVRAELDGQPLDLRARARVDPVQDRRPQRPAVRPGREHARAEARSRRRPSPGRHGPRARARQTSTTPPHQSRSASCSAQPGRGREMPCSSRASATTSPSASTSTALVLEDPTSRPRNRSPVTASPALWP